MPGLLPFETVVRQRRATPHFDGTPLPDAALASLLETALHAPSGYNLQPWRFLVLRSPERKAALRQASFNQEKITEASAVVVAFAPHDGWKETAREVFAESAKRGAIPAEKQDQIRENATHFIEKLPRAAWLNRHVMIAFTHLMLAAEAAGWDTAPMEGFDAEAVRKALGFPAATEIVALLAIGRLKGPDKPDPGRLPLARLVFDDTLDRPWGGA